MSDFFYLDHHTVSRPFPEVMEKLGRLSKEYWASASSSHFLGQQQIYLLEKSLESLTKQLGLLQENGVFWTTTGQDALYEVFWAVYAAYARETGKTLFLISEASEKKFWRVKKQFEELGCSFKTIPVNAKGQISLEALEEAITPKAALVSLSWAEGLTGVLEPIEDLAAICKKKGVLFHVDASYVVGKMFFRFADMDVDFLTFDLSVMHGPRESGLILCRQESLYPSFKVRKNEINTALFSAVAHTFEMLEEKFEQYCMEVARLRDLFEEKIIDSCPGAVLLCQNMDRLPSCSVIAFPPLIAEALAFVLNAKGVYIPWGAGKFPPLEEVLRVKGVSKEYARSALSFCFSYEITEQEIEDIVAVIVEVFGHLYQCAGKYIR